MRGSVERERHGHGAFIVGEVAEMTGFLERDSSFVCAACLAL